MASAESALQPSEAQTSHSKVMTALSEERRWQIISCWRRNSNVSATARAMRLPTKVVARWVRRYNDTGTVAEHRSTGRPRALSPRAVHAARDLLLEDGTLGAAGVAKQLTEKGYTTHQVHRTTISRNVKMLADSEGFPIHYSYGKPSKALGAGTKLKRLLFAKAHVSTNWSNVMFTDRKRFLFKYPGSKVEPGRWVRKGQKYEVVAACKPTCLNLYCGITKWGMIKCHPVAGTSKHKSVYKNRMGDWSSNITADEYTDVLKKTLLPEGARVFGNMGIDNWLLQQDNDPSHVDAVDVVKEWASSHGSGARVLLNWPPNSPDLNLVENVWGYVQRQVDAKGCKTFDEFKEAVVSELARVPKKMIDNLYASMPGRIAKVIERDGGKSGY